MSKIEVDNIVPQSGTNINLGESGDTVTVPAGVTLDTSNSTVTLPDGSVTNAKLANSAITINGSSVSLGGSTTIETGISWQSTIVTGTTLSAVAGNGYWIDTTSNACTVTLPASASAGDQIIFVDYARTWNTNNVTIDQNSLNFQGYSSPNPVYDTDGQTVNIVYSGATQGWIPVSDDDVTNEVPQAYSVDFLVIAGGGGGGFDRGGGGGAGGYRNSYSTESSGGGGSSEASLGFTAGTVYTVTVGAGGAGATSISPGTGANGSDSIISGSDITTITSLGGGGAAGASSPATNNGFSGGSGGGGRIQSTTGGTGGAGTANQGFAGGDGAGTPHPSDNWCGGGGGAGEAGNTDGITQGGDGLSSSITGSAVTRGGGGGGEFDFPPGWPSAYSNGGDGGGGRGGGEGYESLAGTANTGGGGGGGSGGGGSPNNYGDNGGSGVVILRMATADYSGTTSGSPTVSTDGSDTILVFNSSGSYTG